MGTLEINSIAVAVNVFGQVLPISQLSERLGKRPRVGLMLVDGAVPLATLLRDSQVREIYRQVIITEEIGGESFPDSFENEWHLVERSAITQDEIGRSYLLQTWRRHR